MIEGLEASAGAIITVEHQGAMNTSRAAVVLFELPGGFGWLEPAYITGGETGAAPVHAIACEVRRDQAGPGLYFSGPVFSGWIEAAPAGDRGVEAARAQWAARGLTLEGEREAYRAQAAERLGISAAAPA
jgi:hypothetical protein